MIGPIYPVVFVLFVFVCARLNGKKIVYAKYNIIETCRVHFIVLHYWFLVIPFFFIQASIDRVRAFYDQIVT
jgi:hypothetical protein